MKDITRHYSNGEVTVTWRPSKCMHSGICFAGLGKVFDPRRRPWIVMANATTAEIVAQVKDCPSGALSVAPVAHGAALGAEPEVDTDENKGPTVVEVTANGPVLINSPVVVKLPDGTERALDKCALCRCGGSKTKPFCDGTHSRIGFQGTSI